jgi:hypothetical protein
VRVSAVRADVVVRVGSVVAHTRSAGERGKNAAFRG